jgi:hypothetical protein
MSHHVRTTETGPTAFCFLTLLRDIIRGFCSCDLGLSSQTSTSLLRPVSERRAGSSNLRTSGFGRTDSVTPDAEQYDMGHPRRGVALIFNHEKFERLPPRAGSARDRTNLCLQLESLGFETRVHEDLTYAELSAVLSKSKRLGLHISAALTSVATARMQRLRAAWPIRRPAGRIRPGRSCSELFFCNYVLLRPNSICCVLRTAYQLVSWLFPVFCWCHCLVLCARLFSTEFSPSRKAHKTTGTWRAKGVACDTRFYSSSLSFVTRDFLNNLHILVWT